MGDFVGAAGGGSSCAASEADLQSTSVFNATRAGKWETKGTKRGDMQRQKEGGANINVRVAETEGRECNGVKG